MTGVFKANNPYNTVLLLAYGILLKFPIFLHPQTPLLQANEGLLWRVLLQVNPLSVSRGSFLFSLLAFFLLFGQALLINEFSRQQKMLQKPSYLVAMTYLLLTSLFPEWNRLSAPLISSTFILWIWGKMGFIYQEKKPLTTLFNMGFVTGLSTFFYLPSILFVALILLGLLITRPFKPSEWIMAIVGIATPYYFLGAFLFLSDQWNAFYFPKMQVGAYFPGIQKTGWVSILAIGVGALWGFAMMRKNYLRQLIQTRKSWSLIQLYLLLALMAPFFNQSTDFRHWIMALLPLSAIMACAFFYPQKRIFPLIFHWFLFGLAVVTQYL